MLRPPETEVNMDTALRIGRQREQLVSVWSAILIAAGLAVIGVFLVASIRSNPARSIGQLDDFPIGSVTPVQLDATLIDTNTSRLEFGATRHVSPVPIWLARISDTEIRAFYQADPRNGCPVIWQAARQLFIEPCHGSSYALDGSYVRGPSQRNLDRFEVTISLGGTLSIDPNSFTSGDSIP